MNIKKSLNSFTTLFELQNHVNEDPQIKEKLDVLLYLEEVQGEHRVNRVNLTVWLIGLFTVIIVAFSTRFSPMNISNFFGVIIFFLYNSIMFFILRKGIYKPFFKYMTVTFNISTILFMVAGYAVTGNGWLYSLRTITLIGVFLPIIMSGFYQRPGIVIYSSLLAVFEYTTLALYAVLFHKVSLSTEETFNLPLYSIDLIVTYDLVFLFSGFLITIICRQLKILLGRTLHMEAEKYNAEKAKEEIEITSRIKTNLFINLSHEQKPL